MFSEAAHPSSQRQYLQTLEMWAELRKQTNADIAARGTMGTLQAGREPTSKDSHSRCTYTKPDYLQGLRQSVCLVFLISPKTENA